MFDRTVNNSYEMDRALLVRLIRRVEAMAVDLSKLNAAVARNTAAVDKLVAAHSDPAVQAAVDAAADAVNAAAEKAEVAATPTA